VGIGRRAHQHQLGFGVVRGVDVAVAQVDLSAIARAVDRGRKAALESLGPPVIG
jgi:hypothetical protein